MAVTGYQILRNGSLIGTVPGNTFSYSDFGVAASTTYSYTVRAFDAASNFSSPSAEAYVTTPVPTPPPAIPGISCPAAGNGVFTGCYYDNTSLTGNPAFVRTDSQINFDWGSGSPDESLSSSGYSVRWRGDFTFAGGDYTFTATTSDGIRVFIDGSILLDAWRDQPASQYSFRQSLAQGTHRVEVEYYTRNGMSSAHLSWQANPSGGRRGQSAPLISFFSGTPGTITAGQSATLSWIVAGASSLRLDNGIGVVTYVTTKLVSPAATTTYVLTAANDAGSTTASVTIVVNAPAPDLQAPTAPTLFSAMAKSATEVDLSWSASSDNRAVAGYQILRNGSVLMTVTSETWSYADLSVKGSTSYAYAIRAFDAAGNFSQQSNSITAVTPEASDNNDVCGEPSIGAFTACYFNNLTLSGAPALIRFDPQINFDWTSGTPDGLDHPVQFLGSLAGLFRFPDRQLHLQRLGLRRHPGLR